MTELLLAAMLKRAQAIAPSPYNGGHERDSNYGLAI